MDTLYRRITNGVTAVLIRDTTLVKLWKYIDSIGSLVYCAFDIFQKVVFCLVLYTKEVNLQTFIMI